MKSTTEKRIEFQLELVSERTAELLKNINAQPTKGIMHYASDLVAADTKRELLEHLLGLLQDTPSDVQESLVIGWIKDMEPFISRSYNIISNSTDPIYTYSSVIVYKAKVDLLHQVKTMFFNKNDK